VMVVGEDSEACSKVTVPETLESPRTVATGESGSKSARIFRTRHDNSPVSTTRGRQVKGPAKMEAELSLGVAIRVTLLIARWRSNPAHIVSSDPAILPSTPKTTARPGSREISMHDIPALTILALFVVFVNELDVDVKFMCEVVGIK